MKSCYDARSGGPWVRSNGEINLNTLRMARLIAALFVAIVISGCDGLPTGGSGNATSVVIDLEAVAKVTGQDVVIEQKMTAMREELTNQLSVFAADLERQLVEERGKLGDSSDEAAQQNFQQIAAQAQQQLAQQRTLAQQKAQQYQTGLVSDFRKTVEPISAKIASARGAGVILLFDPMMFWFDPSIDITDDVIDALRDQDVEFSSIDLEMTPAAETDETLGGSAETEEVLDSSAGTDEVPEGSVEEALPAAE
jgi:Skp family chaperone for outer membrane proteins